MQVVWRWPLASLKPTRSEVRAFRMVMRKAEGMGLKVPTVKMKVVSRLKGAHGMACGDEITLDRRSFSVELLCHEIAHVLACQLVRDDGAAHNRFWALIYGLLYQSCIQK